MLRTLLWKDAWLNIVVLRIAAFLTVACYVGMAIQGLTPGIERRFHGGLFPMIIIQGSAISHMCLQFSLAILSANLIAAERADGSSEFLTYLPIARKEVLYSKGLLLLGTCAVVSTVHLIGLFGSAWLSKLPFDDMANLGIGFLIISAAGFGACGIGWFASCCMNGNADALLTLIIGFPSINIALLAVVWFFQLEDRSYAIFVSAWIGIGIAGFTWGTRHFVNRIEP